MKFTFILLASLATILSAEAYTVSGNTYITDGSQSDVQAACSGAPDNGTITVLIPNGTYSWTGTLTISHSLSLAGASNNGVTIQSQVSSGSDMIDATSSANGNVNIYWINITQVANNQGGGYALSCNRTEPSSYTVLVHDSNFSSGTIYSYSVFCAANGIIFWNDTFSGSGNNGIGGISFVCQKYGYTGTGSWNTADTFGTLDTTGISNSYIENCYFSNALNDANFDDNSRIVWRYNTNQDAAISGHGQETSIYGSRAWEIYNSTFSVSSGNPSNLQNWFGVRGGTGVITGNAMEDIPFKEGIQLNVYSITRGMNDGAGGTFCPLNYPAPRQTGWSWSASSSTNWGAGDDTVPSQLIGGTSPGVFAPDGSPSRAVLKPVYIWNNTGTETTDPSYVVAQTFCPDSCYAITGVCQTIDGSSPSPCTGQPSTGIAFLLPNRDYYVNTVSPTWAPYTYPHPLHIQYDVGPYSTWERSLFTYMVSIGIAAARQAQVEAWVMYTSPPSTPYSTWRANLGTFMLSVGVSSAKANETKAWVKANPPTP